MSSVCPIILTVGATQVGADDAQLACSTCQEVPRASSVSFQLASLNVVFQVPFQVRSCPATFSLLAFNVEKLLAAVATIAASSTFIFVEEKVVVREAVASTIKPSQISVVMSPIVVRFSSLLSALSAMRSISASTGLALIGMSVGKIRFGIYKRVMSKKWLKY